MTTLNEVRGNVLRMLGANQYFAEVEREIVRACQKLDRLGLYTGEAENVTTTTSAGVNEIASFSSASAYLAAGPDLASDTIEVSRILNIQYLAVERSNGTYDELEQIGHREARTLLEVTSPSSVPLKYARYAQRVVLWPIPDGAYAITADVMLKPRIPSDITSESAYFDEMPDLIEVIAAGQIAKKYMKDPVMAAAYSDEERRLMADISAEDTKKRATGRLTPRS